MEGRSMSIRAALNPGSRNGMPPPGTYVYRGRKREGLPDLRDANRELMKARPPGAEHDAHIADGRRPRRPVTGLPEGKCRNDHPWRAETTSVRADGTRRCLTCRREARARRKEANAA